MARTSEQNSIAQKTWEMANNIEPISSVDEIYRYDRKEQQDILAAKPWEKEYAVSILNFTEITCDVKYVNNVSCYAYHVSVHTFSKI